MGERGRDWGWEGDAGMEIAPSSHLGFLGLANLSYTWPQLDKVRAKAIDGLQQLLETGSRSWWVF
jgi:hypothetical protein